MHGPKGRLDILGLPSFSCLAAQLFLPPLLSDLVTTNSQYVDIRCKKKKKGLYFYLSLHFSTTTYLKKEKQGFFKQKPSNNHTHNIYCSFIRTEGCQTLVLIRDIKVHPYSLHSPSPTARPCLVGL